MHRVPSRNSIFDSPSPIMLPPPRPLPALAPASAPPAAPAPAPGQATHPSTLPSLCLSSASPVPSPPSSSSSSSSSSSFSSSSPSPSPSPYASSSPSQSQSQSQSPSPSSSPSPSPSAFASPSPSSSPSLWPSPPLFSAPSPLPSPTVSLLSSPVPSSHPGRHGPSFHHAKMPSSPSLAPLTISASSSKSSPGNTGTHTDTHTDTDSTRPRTGSATVPLPPRRFTGRRSHLQRQEEAAFIRRAHRTSPGILLRAPMRDQLILGEGRHCQVYLGAWCPRTATASKGKGTDDNVSGTRWRLCAVKRLYPGSACQALGLDETFSLRRLSGHRGIVQLLDVQDQALLSSSSSSTSQPDSLSIPASADGASSRVSPLPPPSLPLHDSLTAPIQTCASSALRASSSASLPTSTSLPASTSAPPSEVAIVLELLPTSLATFAEQHPHAVTLAQWLRWAYGLTEALVWMHSQGAVHADLKKDNILLTETLQVKLCDFNSTLWLDPDHLPTDGAGLSTPTYGAPELTRSASLRSASSYARPSLSPRSESWRSTGGLGRAQGGTKQANSSSAEGGFGYAVDIWSLGAVLYSLACGVEPFAKASSMVDLLHRKAHFFETEEQDRITRLSLSDPDFHNTGRTSGSSSPRRPAQHRDQALQSPHAPLPSQPQRIENLSSLYRKTEPSSSTSEEADALSGLGLGVSASLAAKLGPRQAARAVVSLLGTEEDFRAVWAPQEQLLPASRSACSSHPSSLFPSEPIADGHRADSATISRVHVFPPSFLDMEAQALARFLRPFELPTSEKIPEVDTSFASRTTTSNPTALHTSASSPWSSSSSSPSFSPSFASRSSSSPVEAKSDADTDVNHATPVCPTECNKPYHDGSPAIHLPGGGRLPGKARALLERMLSTNPVDRPSAREAMRTIHELRLLHAP